MTVQIIERNGEPEWAILPYDAYLQLIEQAEMLQVYAIMTPSRMP